VSSDRNDQIRTAARPTSVARCTSDMEPLAALR
jgi:hypothetical protein